MHPIARSRVRRNQLAPPCAALYEVPDGVTSDLQYARYHHLDLSGLDHHVLVGELRLVEIALYRTRAQSDPVRRQWLAERRDAISSELRSRRFQERTPPAETHGRVRSHDDLEAALRDALLSKE